MKHGILLIASSLIAASLIPMTLLPSNVSATVLFVGGFGPGNYTTIQSAVTAASAGDTVFVYNGTYREHITIGKTLTLIGEEANSTIIDGAGSGDVVYIQAYYVNVSGFTIKGSGAGIYDAGLEFSPCNFCRIANNTITQNNGNALIVWSGFNSTIEGNTVTRNYEMGLFFRGGNGGHIVHGNNFSLNSLNTIEPGPGHNWILNNTFASNGQVVIHAGNSDVVSGNVVRGNSGVGIYADGDTNVLIANNTVSGSADGGVVIRNSKLVTVRDNNISGNSKYGVYSFLGSSNNIILNNSITSNNGDGILLDTTSSETIMGNTIASNRVYGINIHDSVTTTVSDNRMTGGNGVIVSGSTVRQWNSHIMDASNLVNGKPLRYLSDATGGAVPLGAGEAILANSSGVIVAGENLGGGCVGIELGFSSFNTISGNNISANSGFGVYSYIASNNTITLNNVTGNAYGIYLGSSRDNMVYHNNLIDNANHAYDNGINNIWDNGYPDGGNFWSGYNGPDLMSGPGQNIAGGDGIGDVPYAIDADSRDQYPLTWPWGFPPSGPWSPVNLKAVGGDRFVNLTWKPPQLDGGSRVTGYVIHRGTSSGSETPLANVGLQTAYNDTAVTNGQTYFYQVNAVNALGDGKMSIEVNATPAARPSAPVGLVASAGDSYINLTWSPPLDNGGLPITGYTVLRSMNPGTEIPLINLGPGLWYNNTGLTNGVRYYYQVTATNAVGKGPRSLEVSAVPAKQPSAPTALAATARISAVNLTWRPPASDGGSPILGYILYRGESSGGETYLAMTGNFPAYDDAAISSNKTYYYTVSAVNVVGEGPASPEVNVTTLPPNRPPMCSINGPSPDAAMSGTVVVFGTASDPDNAVIRVQVRVDNGAWLLAAGTISWAFYLDSRTINDGLHTLEARAYDGMNYSLTDSVRVLVDNTDPTILITAPANGSVLKTTDVNLMWTAADETSGISRFELSIDGGPAMQLGTANSSYLLTGLAIGNHRATIMAQDVAGNRNTSSVSFNVEGSNGLDVTDLAIPLAAIFITVMAIISVAVILKRRRKRDGGGRTEDEAMIPPTKPTR